MHMNQNSQLVHTGDQYSSSSGTRSDERLDSWKEIAFYLHREVRTVQRWEKHEALPVRRHAHRGGNSVYAWKAEIAEWLRRKSAPSGKGVPSSRAVAPTENPTQNQLRMGAATSGSDVEVSDLATILRLLQCVLDALEAHIVGSQHSGRVRGHERPRDNERHETVGPVSRVVA